MSTRIELRERRVPADEVARRRERAVEHLDGLGMIDASEGQMAPGHPDGQLVGYDLTVNGVALPVLVSAYEVVATETGPAVTVTIPANEVQVGVGVPVDEDRKGYVVQTWQGTQRPDPRAGIPGWTPEVARG